MENLDAILQRHTAFWEKTIVAEPLLAQWTSNDSAPPPYPLTQGRNLYHVQQIHADDIDPVGLIGPPPAPADLLQQDKINPVAPRFSEAWMEAIIGCDIYAAPGSCTAKPPHRPSNSHPLPDIDIPQALQSDWLNAMRQTHLQAIQTAGNLLPVRQMHMRGIVDMLAAFWGEENLCLALIENPARVRQVAQQCVQLYIRVAHQQLQQRPTWHGGYVSSWGLFCPEALVDYQIDASNLISCNLYRELLLSFDAQILAAFPRSLIHIHAVGLHILDALLDIEALDVIEISLDRDAGWWQEEKLIHAVEKIQTAGKSALLYGGLSELERQNLLRRLDPAGLAVFCYKLSKSS